MKTLVMVALTVSMFTTLAQANVQLSCRQTLQAAVQEQANKLGVNLGAELPAQPALGGGNTADITVSVFDSAGNVAASYAVNVGETCQAMSVTLVPSSLSAVEACNLEAQKGVQGWANGDKLGMNVRADLPDTSRLQGNEDWIRVPVRDITGVVIASYMALVNETCQVESAYRK